MSHRLVINAITAAVLGVGDSNELYSNHDKGTSCNIVLEDDFCDLFNFVVGK